MRIASRTTTPSARRGSSLIEFVLVGSFVFVPMLAGLSTMGLNMIVALQIANLNSNAAQMFSIGTDFTKTANIAILQAVAGNLQTNTNSGGIVMLTEIDGVGGAAVCKNQVSIPIGIGPSSAFTSRYAPGCSDASAFTAIMPVTDGQVVYLAESYFDTPYPWAFATSATSTGIYVKAIY